MIKVTIEFDTVEAAVVGLGKFAGLPAAGGVAPQAPSAGSSATGRRGRADKGQRRGGYKPRAQEATAGAPVVDGSPAKATGSTVAAKAQEGAKQPATSPENAPAAASTDIHPAVAPQVGPLPTAEQVQKAVEAMFEKVGLATSQDVLSRFGITRARDLLPEHRAEFIDLAGKAMRGETI